MQTPMFKVVVKVIVIGKYFIKYPLEKYKSIALHDYVWVEHVHTTCYLSCKQQNDIIMWAHLIIKGY